MERHAKLPHFLAPNTVHTRVEPVFEQSPLQISNAANYESSFVPQKGE
jgi:hypothetical protein